MSGRDFPFGREFSLEDLPRVDAESLDEAERAEIERAVRERETVISDLRTELLDVRSERDALETRVRDLEETRSELQDRIRQLETERPSLEPGQVLTDFGAAVGDVHDELDADAGFAISDLEVDMKANVVRTEEGMRLHLPSLDEEFAAGTLSELRFTVRRQPPREETEYREIPDLRFTERAAAERRIGETGFALGDVETEPATDDAPGTVLEQFPSPYSVAPPGTEVDLVVAEPPAEPEEPTEPAEPEEPDGPERPLPEVPEGVPPFETLGEFWTLFGERLEAAGIENPAEFVERGPEEIAETLNLDPGAAEALRRRILALLEAESEDERIDLRRIEGIGEAYARRLRDAGITHAGALAARDPGEIARTTGVSEGRAEEWIERARELLEEG